MTSSPSFHDIQQFRQAWVWLLLISIAMIVIGIFAWGMITQLALDRPWGSSPMSDTSLAITGTLVIVFALLFLYAFYLLKLVCEVREGGVHIRCT